MAVRDALERWLDEPVRLLRDGTNSVWVVPRSSRVVRVAKHADFEAVASNLALVDELSTRAPILRPESLVVRDIEGHPATLWPLGEPVADFEGLGMALRSLHDIAAPEGLPRFEVARRFEDRLDRFGDRLDTELRRRVEAMIVASLDAFERLSGPGVLLHGDAHAANMVRFEDVTLN